MKISSQELTNFLNEANKATYANQDAPKSQSLRPSSQDYHFERGNLTYHDTYFGARDFLGEEIVYKAGEPVWGMNYYGYVLKSDVSTKDAYAILRPALMQEYDDILPVRGPREFVLGESKYTNQVEGTLERFSGEEQIYLNGELIYRCWYHGGSIE
ncbi:hypothetical protein C4568_01575 [Candidatus Parcubacteria bacterium]|nr:MAG: hypothetical protein C4568_01575 [Candidatus Parcubacteria bacterium]